MDSYVSDTPYVRPPLKYPPPANCVEALFRKLGFFKPKPLRRPALTRAEEVCNFPDAMSRIKYALSFHPPSTTLRWDKLLAVCNGRIEPTDTEPDPLQIQLDMEELKFVLRTTYHRAQVPSSLGITLMREFLPKMYDKHTLERGKRVSQKERDDKGITDECFAYGELEVEAFVRIYFKVCAAYGSWPKKPCFFDLGCGVGNLVYAAAMIGEVPWKTCGGIDGILALVDRGEKRAPRWVRFGEGFPKEISGVNFVWEQDNFLENPDPWSDATFILLHWTAFSTAQLKLAGDVMAQCREGTLVISFTNPIPNSDFEILIKDSCDVSWGPAVFYIQEKLTPRKAVAGRALKIDNDDDESAPTAGEDEADFMF